MQNTITIEEQLSNELVGLQLMVSHGFWLRKRLLFNILVGLSGLFPSIFFYMESPIFNFLGTLLWGLAANAFYSFGYVIESYIITKSKGKRDLKPYRNSLFWVGTIAYMLVSLYVALVYFITIPD